MRCSRTLTDPGLRWRPYLGPAIAALVFAGGPACRPIGNGALGERCSTASDCNDGLICPADGVAHVTSFCTAPPSRQQPSGRQQWAVRDPAPSASSELEFDVGDASSIRLFNAAQAAGEPDTPHCGFHATCWSPAEPEAGLEVITLHYKDAVHATGVEVVENQNPGTVVRVELIPQNGGAAKVVFEGKDPTRACPGFFGIAFDATAFLTREVRVHLDTRVIPDNSPFPTRHPLVDAVALYGSGTP